VPTAVQVLEPFSRRVLFELQVSFFESSPHTPQPWFTAIQQRLAASMPLASLEALGTAGNKRCIFPDLFAKSAKGESDNASPRLKAKGKVGKSLEKRQGCQRPALAPQQLVFANHSIGHRGQSNEQATAMSSTSAYRSATSPNFEISLRTAESGSPAKAARGASGKRAATAHDQALVAGIAKIFEAELMNEIPADAQEQVSRDLWKAVESHLEQTQKHLTQLQTTFRSLRRISKGRPAQSAPKPVSEYSFKIKDVKRRSHMKF
jgi:hypothetical protein